VAPTDLRIMAKDAPDRLPAYARFPALDIDANTAKSDSPLLYVTSDDAPTLLLAGDKDDLVPVEHSRKIQAAFEQANVKSQLVEFKGAGHGFQGEDAKKSTADMVAWFVTHLAAATPK